MCTERRRNPELRQKIAHAVRIEQWDWIFGTKPGTPWTLSKTTRFFGATTALLLLLLFSPLFVLLAVLIKTTSKGPVFFIQQRTGFCGRRFGLYKFRTMVEDAEALKDSLRHLNKHGVNAIDFKIDHDPRVTKIGTFLRRSSLDELPNLINVVLGDMRLVGPRPTSFHARTYDEEHLARLGIYPGVTGLWQISGRSDIGFTARVELDLQYIANQGPWQDIKILLKTFFSILAGHGAS